MAAIIIISILQAKKLERREVKKLVCFFEPLFLATLQITTQNWLPVTSKKHWRVSGTHSFQWTLVMKAQWQYACQKPEKSINPGRLSTHLVNNYLYLLWTKNCYQSIGVFSEPWQTLGLRKKDEDVSYNTDI